MSAAQPLRGLVFAVARVTLELTSTLSIGTGRGDDVSDSVFVVDANGLPAVPGTSLAGLLRAEVRRRDGDSAARDLFGFQEEDTGASSRVHLSWGAVHGRDDRPVSACLGPLPDDPVLRFVAAGVTRDHVRLSEKGVADRRGKFDVRAVSAGARFTFELRVNSATKVAARADLEGLLRLLASGDLRLGARGRRGAGEFRLVHVRKGDFDLANAEDRARWLKVAPDLDQSADVLEPAPVSSSGRGSREVLALQVEAVDHWIFGTGRPVREEHFAPDRQGPDRKKPHDRVPVTERRIRWKDGRGEVTPEQRAPVLVPATGIKGALRHRTLFHARRICREWAGAPGERAKAAVDELFGCIRSKEAGQRGRVGLSDVFLEDARVNPLQHVSLDRFTQGPMDGLLFSEAPVAGGKLTLRVQVDPPTRDTDEGKVARRAFLLALLDLLEERLALGAGANRGHGWFRGAPDAVETVRRLEEAAR